MADTPTLPPAPISDPSPANLAYGSAKAFVERLGYLAGSARRFQPDSKDADRWKREALPYAMAFVAWYDLTHLLTQGVRNDVRRIYPLTSSSIRLIEGVRSSDVVPSMPPDIRGALDPYRRVVLGSGRFPTLIEAVADELGRYFLNTVYAGRRHPLDPDCSWAYTKAISIAQARQDSTNPRPSVVDGKVVLPLGWADEYNRLVAEDSEAARRHRLGIHTLGDFQSLMVREWLGQDQNEGECTLLAFRCGRLDFADLLTRLDREAMAVLAAEHNERKPAVDSAGADPPKEASAARTEVVLWEGAAHTDHNVRLARTRTAYQEAHGNVVAALAALKADGHTIGKSTFYDHLKALDTELPGWRENTPISGASGNLENGVSVRPRRKSGGKSG